MYHEHYRFIILCMNHLYWYCSLSLSLSLTHTHIWTHSCGKSRTQKSPPSICSRPCRNKFGTSMKYKRSNNESRILRRVSLLIDAVIFLSSILLALLGTVVVLVLSRSDMNLAASTVRRWENDNDNDIYRQQWMLWDCLKYENNATNLNYEELTWW